MQRLIFIAALASSAALVACERKASGARPPASAQTGATATRKPGLWEQIVSSEGRSQVQKLCVGPETAADLARQAAGGGKCGSAHLAGAAHGFTFEITCDSAETGRAHVHGALAGDLSSAYRLTLTATTTGAKGELRNGTRVSTVSAQWKGACPAGMKPGDLELPDGVRIHP